MQSPDGILTTPPIETKESLHELPAGYTAGFADKTRRKMLGNSWRVGAAKLLLWLLIAQLQLTPTVNERIHQIQSYPNPRNIKELWLDQPLIPGPAPKIKPKSYALEQVAGQEVPEPGAELFSMEMGLLQVLHHQEQWAIAREHFIMAPGPERTARMTAR